MSIIEIIEKKKQGQALSQQDIKYFVEGVTSNLLPNYQISALLMAIVLKGMNEEETYHLTKYMLDSGESIDTSAIEGIIIDKHSTGGVGDSTSFVVAPIVSALGLKVAKMSGRGLGFTGGTIDKLEAITGFCTSLTSSQFKDKVNTVGMAIMQQSTNICPADKKLYALRDVTATVDSLPLIASSIMSKKLAGGASVIVLDVKYGNGAFLQDKDKALGLARSMVAIGKQAGRKIRAIITDMNQPLDEYIGNKLDVLGAVRVLKGEKNRLYEVSLELAVQILQLAYDLPREEAKTKVIEVLESGQAYKKFLEFVEAQGGEIGFVDNIEKDLLPIHSVKSIKSGYISYIDCRKLGNILRKMGGGRENLDDKINHEVGLRSLAKLGSYIEKGDTLVDMYYSNNKHLQLEEELLQAYIISNTPISVTPLIWEIVR